MFDLAILGGGPAGQEAAMRARKADKSVVLFEEKALGGVCLNEGCIPTKTMLNAAHLMQKARSGALFGVAGVSDASLDHLAVLARKQRVVRLLGAGVSAALKDAGVRVIAARAQIEAPGADGFCLSAGDETFAAERLLIATGSSPSVPPIAGLDAAFSSGFAMTSDKALCLERLPGRLLVLGAGVVGLELADYFDAAGVSVTVVELCDSILPGFDTDLSAEIQKSMQKRGTRFITGAKVTAVEHNALVYEQNGKVERVAGDALLCAVGRKPNTAGFGLAALFSEEPSALTTDAFARTACPGVWAAGDVNGRSMLAHTATREAYAAVCDMFFSPDEVRYDAIPAVLYTNPEAASIGYTKKAAEESGFAVEERAATLRQSGRFVAETAGENGLCKAVLERKTGRILGVHLCGEYASEIIACASVMLAQKLCAADVSGIVFAHPTVGEVLRSVLL